MALKTKRSKRSLVTLKRNEASLKQQQINEFTRLIIDGKIDLASLIPAENVTEEELSKYPSIDEISAEMVSKLNQDIQHDTEVMDEFLTKYENHPLSLRLQLTLMFELAKNMPSDKKEELYNYITDKDNVYLEPDDSLNDKIFDSIALGSAGRTKKCIKNLQACIRRIEAKKTPHMFHDRPVYSFESLIHENLCFPDRSDESTSDYYQPPAAYAIAYSIYAEKLMTEGNMAEALKALNESLSWNPVNAASLLAKANILAEIGCSLLTIETLEKTYPYIVTTDELMHFYLIHSMLLFEDDNEDAQKLSAHIINLSNYLLDEDTSNLMISTVKDIIDIETEPISRETFIEQLKAMNIPFGISETAVKAIEKTIATYQKNEDTKENAEVLQKELDHLKTCLDSFTEI